jgi:hypothetical protein
MARALAEHDRSPFPSPAPYYSTQAPHTQIDSCIKEEAAESAAATCRRKKKAKSWLSHASPSAGNRSKRAPSAAPMTRVVGPLLRAALVLLVAAAAGAAAITTASGRRHPPARTKRRKSPPAFCKGRTCRAMSDLLPTLAFAPGQGPVSCSCADFLAGSCFAPGCSVCDKACFANDPALARAPGPFGTGLLCSSGCEPCCQDPDLVPGSTCVLPAGGCQF